MWEKTIKLLNFIKKKALEYKIFLVLYTLVLWGFGFHSFITAVLVSIICVVIIEVLYAIRKGGKK